MPANTPFMVVRNGPAFTPLKYGLLSAAEIVTDADPHWQVGIQWQPDACAADRSVTAFCWAGGPASGTPAKIPSASGAASTAAEPYTVYAYTTCAPVGWGDRLEDMIARATRQLDAGEGRAVERVFWAGAPDGGPTVFPHLAHDAQVLANPQGPMTVELQPAATVVTGTFRIIDAVAAVEGALAACYGGEGVIHIPCDALTGLAAMGALVRDGPNIRTWAGNKVAVYSANLKTAPDHSTAAAGSAWVYGTGAVWAWRSPVKPAGQKPSSFVGRNDNSTVYVVERTYVIDWDCCLFAAKGGYNTSVASP
jgi:hypothetical protein